MHTSGRQTLSSVIHAEGRLRGLDLTALSNELVNQAQAVQHADLARGKAMLMVQVHSLGAIYNNLAQRAINTKYLDKLDRYLRLAFKAQAQCCTPLQFVRDRRSEKDYSNAYARLNRVTVCIDAHLANT
jgi:hypothetical protein